MAKKKFDTFSTAEQAEKNAYAAIDALNRMADLMAREALRRVLVHCAERFAQTDAVVVAAAAPQKADEVEL